LLTKEFYNLVKEHLAEGGVVAQNIEPTTMLFDSAVLTINSVFPELDFYLAEGNVVTVAYEKPLSSQELQQAAETTQKMFNFRYNLSQMLGERRRLNLSDTNIIDKKAKILTDDFAPVETLKAIEQHNRKWPEH
jgi:spermidine synthase